MLDTVNDNRFDLSSLIADNVRIIGWIHTGGVASTKPYPHFVAIRRVLMGIGKSSHHEPFAPARRFVRLH
jgi:hypothetical protein